METNKIMQSVVTRWLKYRYLLLSLMLFALMALSVSKQFWVGDFWEHSAVINELAYNPIDPKHSLLSSDAPHALFSPYALFWGLFSRLTHIGPIKTLSIAGIINLFLLLIGLYLFISALWPKERDGIAYYGLLLILLLWGSGVWNFSGFFHLRVLGYVLPYPSTFNAALAFIILAINHRRIEKKQPGLWAPILLLSLIVILSHQFTFIFLASGIIAMGICKKGEIRLELFQIAGFFALLLLLASFWPYYPFLKLIFGGASVYDSTQKAMYQYLILRLWPALIGIPFLVIDFRANWRQPLLVMFAILALIYIGGFLLAAYSYGRVISFLVMIIQLTLAKHLVQFEKKPLLKFVPANTWPLVFSLGVTFILLAAAYLPFISPALERSIAPGVKTYEPYYFLNSYVDHYDVVLTDPRSTKSILVPSFSGKLVASYNDLPFVPDLQDRIRDAIHFFGADATQSERQDILHKYGVQYVLLENSQSADRKALLAAMKTLGEVVYRNNRFILYSVDSK